MTCFHPQCMHWIPRPLLWLGHGDEEMHNTGRKSEHESMGAKHYRVSSKSKKPLIPCEFYENELA